MTTNVTTWAPAVVGLASFLAAAGCTDAPVPGERRPSVAGPVARNVVVVSLDTVRADHLACYGYDRPTSPTLDRLAREGTLFENAVATSPWTLPSHASLLTGVYPHRHGAVGPSRGLPPDLPSLATILAEAGFVTAGFVSSAFLTAKRGFDRGFSTYRAFSEWGRREDGEKYLRNPGDEVSDAVLAWLRERGDERFFLFVHYYDAHADYAPPEAYRRGLVGSYDGPADGTNAQLLDVRRRGLSYEKADIDHVVDLYDAEIRAVDAQLGRVVDQLDESGLTDSTLVIVTSDHGEAFLEHDSVLHGRTFYEEVIAVPLLARGPGVPPGLRVAAPASLVDVVPTVLARTGVGPLEATQGIDLARLWAEDPQRERRYVMAEADWQNRVPGMYRMVRDDRYKLIQEWRTGRTELYDLAEDPHETEDLADANPSLTASLEAVLAELMASGSFEGTATPVSGAARERLRALGYID